MACPESFASEILMIGSESVVRVTASCFPVRRASSLKKGTGGIGLVIRSILGAEPGAPCTHRVKVAIP